MERPVDFTTKGGNDAYQRGLRCKNHDPPRPPGGPQVSAMERRRLRAIRVKTAQYGYSICKAGRKALCEQLLGQRNLRFDVVITL